MNYHKTSTGFILRLNKDEKLVETLNTFIKEKDIKAGWFTGLGGVQGAEIGFYNLDSKEYEWRTFIKLLEITNLTGNITYQNDRLILHIHATLTDDKLRAHGGHVRELVVGGTVEINLTTFNKKIERTFDKDTGLNLLDI